MLFFAKQDVWVNRTYFVQKGLPLKRIICAMKKEVNSTLDTVTTTPERVYGILEIVLRFVPFCYVTYLTKPISEDSTETDD